jgi:transposase InsO family protein
MPKFNGKADGLPIESFIIIFESLFDTLSDADKRKKIVGYLEGDAAHTYAIGVLSNTSITWDDAKTKLTERFGHSELTPIAAASRRRLIKSETIRDYYDEKTRILRRIKGLTEQDMSDFLTEGLPDCYRPHFYGRRFTTTSEWLRTAQDIEADLNRRPHQHSTKSQGSNHFSRTVKQSTNQNNQNRNNRNNQTSGRSNRQPPYACKICRDKGLTEYHWHSDCPNRTASDATNQNSGGNNSNNNSNAISNYIRKQVMTSTSSQTTPEIVLIPAKIGRFELSAFADIGSTINIIAHHVAQHLKLRINRRDSEIVRLAQGSAQTIGSVTFSLTINGIHRRLTAQVLKGFQFTLLLSLHALADFRAIIDTETRRVSFKINQSQSTQPKLENKNHCQNIQSTKEKQNKSNTTPAMVDSIPTNNHQINQLILEYEHIFASNSTDLSRIDIEEHSIELLDDKPIAQRPYRQSLPIAAETARQVQDLLSKGLIRESVSPFAAPVTLVDKRDGSKRLCIDYRRLNAKTIADKTPLPVIADVIDLLRNSTMFSKLDFASGYWQVPIKASDISKTAFVTRDGHYEWLVLPFGLKNSPATFHRVVRKILGNLLNNGIFSYMDDIIVYAKAEEEHNRLLKEVFSRLSQHNARLKREKCEFGKSSIEFLGHIINGTDVRPPPMKIKAIVDYPTPATQPELQRFHGLVNYLREYIPDMATITEPLTRLLRKNKEFIWSTEQQNSFDKLKQILTESPVRHIYDPTIKCELHTDASLVGIAGILIQNKHPIGYYSRKLSDAETRYSATELECLAVHDSVKYFRIYLEGNHFKVFTDHIALKWLHNFHTTKRRLFHWSEELSHYSFDIVHRPGRHMAHVDALSRAPVVLFIQSQDILSAQKTDFDTNAIYNKSTSKINNPSNQQKANQDIADTKYSKFVQNHDFDQIKTINKNGRLLTLVPPSIVNKLLIAAHDQSGHPGIRKTQKSLQNNYFWPNMRYDISTHIKTCHTCQIIKTASHPPYGPLQPLPTPLLPLELISIDTVVMGSSADKTKAKFLQVIIDHSTRFVWAKPTKTNTAEAAISAIEEVFRTVGKPKRILTDNGKNFTSKKFQKFSTQHGIQRSFTSTYHPQCNGMNEKVNDTIIRGLRIETHDHPRLKWSTLVKKVVDNYNNTVHSTTGFTPSFLMFGTDRLNTSEISLQTARLQAQQRSDDFKAKKKQIYDQKHPSIDLKIGDLIKRRIPSNRPDLKKLTQRYEAPFEVVDQSGPVDYRIRKYPNDGSDPFLVHVSQVEPYFLRDQTLAVGE